METAIVLQKLNSQVALNWAALIAFCRADTLNVFYVAASSQDVVEESIDTVDDVKTRTALQALLSSGELSEQHVVRVFRVSDSAPLRAIERGVDELEIDRLLVLRDRGVRSDSAEFALGRALMRDLPCEVVQLSIGESGGDRAERVIVGIGTGAAAGPAVQLAADIAEFRDGRATAVGVEEDTGDLAADVARRTTERVVAESVRRHRDRVDVELVLGREIAQGLREASADCDLLILGASHHSVIHRWLFSSVSEKLISQHDGPTIAVLRPALAWSNRLGKSLAHVVRETVPQLDRSRRLKLFERVQSASQWNFDFVALISLSTLIAALGLLRNSTAVVIGAMLVAPLMTPLLGIGLSITQGNIILARTSSRTVALGFMSSFCIGVLTALVFSSEGITEQIVVRGSPGPIDLLVAFFSGVAAAYAIGRPNLLSALPGVAIATALVPPVASSGVALARGEYELAWGASLLFFTNIVAIVLGAALSFWLAGIRVMHTHGGFAKWSRAVAIGLLMIAFGLAVYESLPRDHKRSRLRDAIAQVVASDPAAEVSGVEIVGRRRRPAIAISVNGPNALGEPLRRQIVETARKWFPEAESVEIRFHQVWRFAEDTQ